MVELEQIYTYIDTNFNAHLEALGVHAQVWPSHVAAFPGVVFVHPPLNLPFGTSGLGQGGRAHSTNEYITVEGIKAYEKYSVALLYEFATL